MRVCLQSQLLIGSWDVSYIHYTFITFTNDLSFVLGRLLYKTSYWKLRHLSFVLAAQILTFLWRYLILSSDELALLAHLGLKSQCIMQLGGYTKSNTLPKLRIATHEVHHWHSAAKQRKLRHIVWVQHTSNVSHKISKCSNPALAQLGWEPPRGTSESGPLLLPSAHPPSHFDLPDIVYCAKNALRIGCLAASLTTSHQPQAR